MLVKANVTCTVYKHVLSKCTVCAFKNYSCICPKYILFSDIAILILFGEGLENFQSVSVQVIILIILLTNRAI